MPVVKPNPGNPAYLLLHGNLQIKLNVVLGLKMWIISKEVSLLHPASTPHFLTPVPYEGKLKRGGLITKPLQWKLHCPKDLEVIPVIAMLLAGVYQNYTTLHFSEPMPLPSFFWAKEFPLSSSPPLPRGFRNVAVQDTSSLSWGWQLTCSHLGHCCLPHKM